MNKALVQVDERGGITLPDWVVAALLKKAGVRSRRKRIVKKVIKREFERMVREVIKEGV